MKKITFAAAAMAALGIAGAAIGASHADPAIAGAIKARKATMQLYAYNLGQLGAMAKGDMEYDADAAQAAADNLVALSGLNQMAMWPQGSDNTSGAETRALPALWEDMAGVEEAAGALHTAAMSMAEVAGNGVEAIQANMGALGGGCGGCHKAYRAAD